MPKITRIRFDGDIMIDGFSFGHFAKLSVSCKRLDIKEMVGEANHTGKFADTRKVGINGYASISVTSAVQKIEQTFIK